MKRYGEKETREAIKNGAIIRAWDFYTLLAGYKVTTEDGETLGYITSDLFAKLLKSGDLVKIERRHGLTDYGAPVVITYDDEPAEAIKRQTRDILNNEGIAQAVNFLFTCDYTANDARAVLLFLGVDDADAQKVFKKSFGVEFSTLHPAAPFKGNAPKETARSTAPEATETPTETETTASTTTNDELQQIYIYI